MRKNLYLCKLNCVCTRICVGAGTINESIIYIKNNMKSVLKYLLIVSVIIVAASCNNRELNTRVSNTTGWNYFDERTTNFQANEGVGNVNPVGIRSCYDEGKRIAETIMYEYHKLGVKCKIIRIFNTYGPYMDPNDGPVISNFVCQALLNKDITIYGDGTQTR